MTDSRAWSKRVWRVPKDKGAVVYAAALCHKMLVKHNWPAVVTIRDGGFSMKHKFLDQNPPDFVDACSVAFRTLGRVHKLDLFDFGDASCWFNREYRVVAGGFFREVKDGNSTGRIENAG
jgi:hypothetical protein